MRDKWHIGCFYEGPFIDIPLGALFTASEDLTKCLQPFTKKVVPLTQSKAGLALHNARLANAARIVELKDTRQLVFSLWFERWSRAPDKLTMNYLLLAAENSGASKVKASLADAKHERNRDAKSEAIHRWNEMKKKNPSISKNDAAEKIAKQVHLSEVTVRKYLRNL